MLSLPLRITCLIRQLLLCLLVLALPAQGVSAATMSFCGPAHHQPAPAAAANPHAHHGMAADHGAMPSGHTDHATHAGAAEPATAAPDPAEQAHATQTSCSACAVCCAAFALQAGPLRLPVAECASTTAAALPASAPVFVTGGPERPPRPLHT